MSQNTRFPNTSAVENSKLAHLELLLALKLVTFYEIVMGAKCAVCGTLYLTW
jgi:hypothetical protein